MGWMIAANGSQLLAEGLFEVTLFIPPYQKLPAKLKSMSGSDTYFVFEAQDRAKKHVCRDESLLSTCLATTGTLVPLQQSGLCLSC